MPAGRCSRVQLTTKTDLGESLLDYTFYTADVFTNRSFQGAQIAVFPEAKGLNTHAMQQLANELNLSETVFVFNSNGEGDGRTMCTFSPVIRLSRLHSYWRGRVTWFWMRRQR
jgi:16S rRNA G1207 methylase RsmC